jgi:hypothetical protein
VLCCLGSSNRFGWFTILLIAALVSPHTVPSVKAQTIIGVDSPVATQVCGAGGCTSALSWLHTVGSNSNRILVVGVASHASSAVAVTTVTYGVYALTALAPQTFAATIAQYLAQQWYLSNPPSGANTVTVRFASAPEDAVGASVSFFNVGGVGEANGANGGGSLASVTINSAKSGELVVDTHAAEPALATAGSHQNELWNVGDPDDSRAAGSDQPASSLVTMQWTFSTPVFWGLVAVDLQPSTTTTTSNTTVIPEYPLGLPILSILIIIAYGLIRRRTSNREKI